MKKLSASLIMGAFALAMTAQPVYAKGYGDHDRWDRPGNHGRGHAYGHYKHPRHNHYPNVVYRPASVYYYAPPQVVYYPQPVYSQPIYSINWIIR